VSATAWRRIQLGHVFACLALIAPAVTWWRESLPFLVGISVWSLVAGAGAAWQAARAEEGTADREDVERVERKVDELLALVRSER